MKEMNIYDLNRAVHLARCEVFLEISAIRLADACAATDPHTTQKHLKMSIYFLESALEHAGMLTKSSQTLQTEKACLIFFRFLRQHLLATNLLLEANLEITGSETEIKHFLGPAAGELENQECASFTHKLLQKAAGWFHLAQEPLRNLRQTSLSQMDAEDLERFQTALKSLREHQDELENHHQNNHSRPNFRFSS